MIKKTISFLLIIIVLSLSHLRADEGMWIPLLLKKYNIEIMKKKGFKLTADDIYSINKVSMKDAVMIFGGGCTGELISDKGLLITNHHCGYGAIQSHSSLEHDYLTDGFWAMSQTEELENEGLSVTFLIKMEDVSEKVLLGINDTISETEKQELIKNNIENIEKKAIVGTHYTAKVKPFFNGNQYFLFVQEVFKDVRLVGAPPSSIGKFGGDTDNWMWPRHTGDFSLFRIYADKNNQPAEYSLDNVPYKPKKHFPISLKGVKKGDFTMVFGYPGRTQEYLTSYAVNMIKNEINPYRIDIRKNIIDIMGEDMNKDRGIRIKYSSKYARKANYWKKWIGENRGLKRLNAVYKKQQLEKELVNRIEANEKYKQKYGHLLKEYKDIYENLTPYKLAEEYFFEAIWSMESVNMTSRIGAFLKKGDSYTPEDINKLKKSAKNFFKNYNVETDKKIFRKLIEMYHKNAGVNFQPDFFSFIILMEQLEIPENKAFDLYTDYYFKKTFFLDEDKFNNFINNYETSKSEEITNTPAYKFYRNFINFYILDIMPTTDTYKTKIDKLDKLYMLALMETDTAKIFYPNANSTLRVAYGQVDDYFPRDGVYYNYYTTLKGIMQKDNPDIYDYDVPEKLKELYRNKDYGDYGEDGKMHVCFTASNHTTGGNSGSPVINGDGELIGINFDRNWEGTMSDIMYDPDQCRNISLDIRYALFIIDKFAGATHLIKEMTIKN